MTKLSERYSHCGERYSLTHRAGRNGRAQTLHKGRRYCSATSRKMAHKHRAKTGADRPSIRFSGEPATALQMTFGDYTVVPDAEWPKMYRVRRPDGTLTDMVNLSRARDAARHLSEAA